MTTAAERYLQKVQKHPPELVDVTLPSGGVITMQKPGKFGLLFGIGRLPQQAASMAVEKWAEQGIIEAVEEGDEQALTATMDMVEIALKARDRVLELSHSPKLVIGKADPAKNEVSTDNVPDDDLAYLLKWVQTGGDVSLMLDTFPEEPYPGAMASVNRKGRRAAAKRSGRN